ncbi:MAG: oligopeptidase A [Methylotetracoccus sp.]|nr:oligopeptidase A [Methylotetracoccus sp.]
MQVSDVVPAIETVLAENRAVLSAITNQRESFTWDNLVRRLEDLEDRLNKAWSPVGHLNAVVNSEELRAAYNVCLPLLSEYATEVGQNERLFEAYRGLGESSEAGQFDHAQRKIIADALRDFRLSGVDLPPDKKARFKAIAQELSTLQSKFQDNLLDATQAWSKLIDDPALLAGIPENARAAAKQAAELQGRTGWVFNLEFPSYIAVMTYADDRVLREEFYTAFCTRASDQGPNAGRWDNSKLMEQILALRHEQAQLLGFAHYAELSLATKMAESSEQVIRFLMDLADHSLSVARRDLAEMQDFARVRYRLDILEVWDLSYVAEKLRHHRYAFSEEEVRAYFPAPGVVQGMFSVAERVYGLTINEREGVEVWHPDVRFYDIFDHSGELRGSFYLDLYARPQKRGGAWMDACVTRRKVDEKVQRPVAFLVCNFTSPAGGTPALLRHAEVVTLFHEFGHGLHHLLTRVDYRSVSGIHGVEWDAVELPSQFMENFCWYPEAIGLISGHFQTGERLPHELFAKMTAAKNFQAGMQMVRQIELALFDFRLHAEYDPLRGGRVQEVLDEVRSSVAVVIPPRFNRFQHSFSHIFSGGYAAGYYSYKWAEVLSSDAFARFEDEGVFNPQTGASFLSTVLEQGGTRRAMELFVAFRGREPTIDALLRHNGMLHAA